MRYYDAVIIGGGVIGCFAARNLCRWNLKTALIEASPNICSGISKANSGICYAGYDHVPGSLKATYTIEANQRMGALCEELDVPFERPGGLMTAIGPRGETTLKKKLAQGTEKGVPGLRIISGDKARELEPMLDRSVTSALWAPTTGIVNPWALGIAAFENAVRNGCFPMLSTMVTAIDRGGNGYIIQTDRDEIECRAVINCAGLNADRVRELLFSPEIRLFPTASDYLVFDKNTPKPAHVLFQETEGTGKGVTVIPTTDGNLLTASPARPMEGAAFSVSAAGLEVLRTAVKAYLPGLELSDVIRSFGAVRPNPFKVILQDGEWVPDGRSIGSFVIDRVEPGFISTLGIKTPGLTCSNQLGMHLATCIADYLCADERKEFSPQRESIVKIRTLDIKTRADYAQKDPAFGDVICRCGDITRGEVLQAIERGADTIEKIRRYLGTGMGRCQGSRCGWEIEKILKEVMYGKS